MLPMESLQWVVILPLVAWNIQVLVDIVHKSIIQSCEMDGYSSFCLKTNEALSNYDGAIIHYRRILHAPQSHGDDDGGDSMSTGNNDGEESSDSNGNHDGEESSGSNGDDNGEESSMSDGNDNGEESSKSDGNDNGEESSKSDGNDKGEESSKSDGKKSGGGSSKSNGKNGGGKSSKRKKGNKKESKCGGGGKGNGRKGKDCCCGDNGKDGKKKKDGSGGQDGSGDRGGGNCKCCHRQRCQCGAQFQGSSYGYNKGGNVGQFYEAARYRHITMNNKPQFPEPHPDPTLDDWWNYIQAMCYVCCEQKCKYSHVCNCHTVHTPY